jgi:hypothetical protein
MVTRLKEINDSMESIENVIKKGGNTLDTQEQLLLLYRELQEEKLAINKELLYDTL